MLMESLQGDTGMLAIMADEDRVRAELGRVSGELEIAAMNSPLNTVVLGVVFTA